MPKDKQGNKLTWKEFFAKWREGIDGITPIQKIKTQLLGTRISLVGVLMGLIISIISYRQLWWVGIILLGALINMGVQYLGLVQQKNTLVKHEANCDEMSIDELMNEETLEEDLNELKKEGGKQNRKI